ncbi:LysR family transcriptional regulator [Paraburkholderia metrosideri]|uniref:Nodulation protein D 2 n=1 Tax=Paraburkholderia metrosideri TaxID=580937 RepID=A0ABM8NTY7_9BURK|nr:LysR family transcriptional regulator [Paraburkholderia metrosideri]CAD6543180.1 Nodulation protein D 2 [Paraburkholderia metrosideri]
MRYRQLDLNLLVALDALLAEKSITNAAARLHLSQPAVSNILARLREFFADELLVPSGRRMIPTALANELTHDVRDIVMRIEQTLERRSQFDPATSERHIRVIASDYLVTVLLSEAVRRLQTSAPRTTIEILLPGDDSVAALRRGDVDLLATPFDFIDQNLPYVPLLSDEYVGLIWTGNGQISERITAAQYRSFGHVGIRFGANRQESFEERYLKRKGFDRRLEVIAPDFNTLPQMLVGTTRIATVHHRLAQWYVGLLPLRIVDLPVKIPPLTECLQWPAHLDNDSGHRFVRQTLLAAAGQLKQ